MNKNLPRNTSSIKKGQRNYLIPSIITLTALATLTTVYLKMKNRPSFMQQKTILKNQPEIMEWKTYTDPGNRYSYHYPGNLFYELDPEHEMVFYYPNEKSLNNEKTFQEALFYIQVTIEDESSCNTFTNNYLSANSTKKYKDTLGRIWSTVGPIWGEGDSSNHDAEISYKGKCYKVGSQFYGKNLSIYLNRKLIVQKGQLSDASQLVEEHDKLIKQILSSFRFNN